MAKVISMVLGLTMHYFWAINDHSDATFKLGYQGKRGFAPSIEYRYTPTLNYTGCSGKIYR